MRKTYLYFILLFMSISSLYGQDHELSEEQYAILNLELFKGDIYEYTNFAYYWGNCLTLEWLSENGVILGYQLDDKFESFKLSEFIDNKTLGTLRTKISNQQGPKIIRTNKLVNPDFKVVSEYNSNEIRYLSAPIIEGDFAVMFYRYGYEDQIVFFKKSQEGIWEKAFQMVVFVILVGY
ncbi:hypothetical protein ACFSKL_12835 [Belliella marina]|uniref:Uncharacterized protein n=1 Tax=Belliella marina TaxID=1644146 RepID=A0ABW4VQZ0_9BACT